MKAKRNQTQPIVIPNGADDRKRAEVIRMNENFRLLDQKIEQIWKKIAEMEAEDEGGD